MIKNLRYVMLSLIAMVCGTMAAQKVTIDFDTDYATLFPTLAGTSSNDSHDGDFTETTTSTAVEGVTATVSVKDPEKKTAENRIWSSAPRLRMYSGTFTVTGKDITKIEFTANSNFGLSTTTGTLDGKTWTGKADEIVFNVGSNTQINKIVVTLGESADDDDPIEPELPAGGTKTDPWTVAEALTASANLGADEFVKGGEEVYVKGIITKIDEVSVSYGNATYYISDDVTGSNSLEVFRGYSLNGEKFTSEDEIKVGDKVIVCGKITNYKGTTLEFNTGSKIVSLNGETGGSGEGGGNGGSGNEEPDEPVTGDNLLVNGDFETWTEGFPVNWKSTTTASSAILSQSTDAHNGNYAVKVKHDASSNKRISYKEITLKAGTYTASFYVKAADGAGTSVNPGYVAVGDDGKVGTYNYDGYVNDITTTWQQVTFNFTLAAQSTINLLVMVPKNAATDAIIDDFTLSVNNGETSSIDNITTAAQSGQAYNMAGQKVSDNYRGLVIKNGKKVMMK